MTNIGQQSVLAPGGRYESTLDGNMSVYTPNTYTIDAADVQVLNHPPMVSIQQNIIVEELHYIAKFTKISLQQTQHPSTDWLEKISADSDLSIYSGSPIAAPSKQVVETLQKQQIRSIRNINQRLRQEQRIEKDRERLIQNVRKNAQSFFDSLLGTLVDTAIDEATKQIKKLLPASIPFDINVSRSSDGTLSFDGLSIAGLTYNPNENTINYGGQQFNALVNTGLSAVNNLLPDFLNMNVTAQTIGLGNGVTVDLDELQQNPGEVKKLSNALGVSFDGQQFQAHLGKSVFDLGTRTAIQAAQPGLSSLNRFLPSGLQASVTQNPQGGLPTIAMGPVKLDLASGSLSFDAIGAANKLSGFANNYIGGLASQLPAPLATVARALWNSFDIGSIMGNLFNPFSRGSDGAADPSHTLAVRQNQRNQTGSASPPITIIPPPSAKEGTIQDVPTSHATTSVA